MKTLHLTLKKQWFDMILSGEKTEEYRENKPYWHKRLVTPETHDLQFPEFIKYDTVIFRNGYGLNAPAMEVVIKKITISQGKEEWGAIMGQHYYTIKLGKILSTSNLNQIKA